jgi:inhibitor of KinA sporulation pathway (predicted exonuclease)
MGGIKMATTVHEAHTIKLIDGTEITLRPLKISLLRKFMKKFEGIAGVVDDNDKSINLLMECVLIAMEQYKPELAVDLAALEDNIDLPTVYQIVEVASGIPISEAAAMFSGDEE